MARITNLADLDLCDLPLVREQLKQAQDVGHWRRIVSIYGDHLGDCAIQRAYAVGQLPPGDHGIPCDCGWEDALK